MSAVVADKIVSVRHLCWRAGCTSHGNVADEVMCKLANFMTTDKSSRHGLAARRMHMSTSTKHLWHAAHTTCAGHAIQMMCWHTGAANIVCHFGVDIDLQS